MGTVMNPKEFAAKMRAIGERNSGDNEAMHGDGDDLMCKLLEDLGYEEGIQVYKDWVRWYA